MDAILTVVVSALGGVVVGAGLTALVCRAVRARRTPRDSDLARSLLDRMRSAVVVLDSSDRVLFANPVAVGLRIVKSDSPELSLVPLRELVAEARRTREVQDIELDLPHKDGPNPLGVRVRVSLLDGDQVHLEMEDVTEAHRVARVRRDFVANVSHELKTPVGALQLLSEALNEAVDDPPTARRFIERIQYESTRLARLINELIELSRLQGAEPLPTPEPVSVNGVIAEVLDRTRTAAAAKKIEVRWEGDRHLTVYGHEGQLATALANLVHNAIAYSAEGTHVEIRTAIAGKRVKISVTDEGIGIAPEDTSRIFERFYRADQARSRSTGGTGLGLAIVKHIASNHGGRVDVSSVPGRGSTFTLRLPSRPPLGTSASMKPVPMTGVTGTSGTNAEGSL
ncbi:MAG: ATP-binding protein [Longispora sp.]|nr:ATP-binding protein [Longispora sp. (in: high G+C Gram-positive bacteria)]